MKINGRDVTLTEEELDLLQRLKANGVISITKSDEDAFMWHDGDFSLRGSTINVRWFKGFDFMENDEIMDVQMLLDMSKKQKTVWDLQNGDKYDSIDSDGFLRRYRWYGSNVDCAIRSQGNAFMTREEAEFEKKRREVVTKVKKYARPFIPNGENWFPYWNCIGKSIVMSYVDVIQDAKLYFESKEKFEQAIAEVGEEDFKKYYLGVVEDESRKTCKD